MCASPEDWIRSGRIAWEYDDRQWPLCLTGEHQSNVQQGRRYLLADDSRQSTQIVGAKAMEDRYITKVKRWDMYRTTDLKEEHTCKASENELCIWSSAKATQG